MPELYVAYLGGAAGPGRMSEDHEVVLVVASDEGAGGELARSKWAGVGRGHADSIRVVDQIDGYIIRLDEAPGVAS